MSWFDTHASGIQALAGVATFLVTAFLAYVTYRYMRLTRSIAGSALEQVEHMKVTSRRAQKQAGLSLDALSKRLRVPLAALDPNVPRHAQLLEYTLISERDIQDLEALARQVSAEAITYAGKAAVSLRTILGLLDDARSVNRLTGWIATEQQVNEWRTAREAGPRMLEQLEAACRVAAAV